MLSCVHNNLFCCQDILRAWLVAPVDVGIGHRCTGLSFLVPRLGTWDGMTSSMCRATSHISVTECVYLASVYYVVGSGGVSRFCGVSWGYCKPTNSITDSL
jgi:hypothetical protein